jgi:hypothetical protein
MIFLTAYILPFAMTGLEPRGSNFMHINE